MLLPGFMIGQAPLDGSWITLCGLWRAGLRGVKQVWDAPEEYPCQETKL